MSHSILVRFAAALVVLGTWAFAGGARASEPEPVEAFVSLGGGGHCHVGGVDAGTRPAASLGVGLSASWLSVEAAFSWTRIEWSQQPVCPLWAGAPCNAIAYDGELLGLLVQARLSLLGRGSMLRPYLSAGAGGALLDFRSDGGRASRTWGLGLMAGGGLEVEILGDLSLNLGVAYALTLFQGDLSWRSDASESVLVTGSIRYYL
ncbi:MAG: hypothetical protein JXR96_12375 [Deltaproteobacteria bacterium]|nr:hypothetical protein [Deltaproteobacteria bacterium]